MLIIAGHLIVDRAERDGYLAECRSVVEAARAAAGCLDFSVTPDTIDPARIVIFERWESEEELMTFRGSGPSDDQQLAILDADVKRYTISAVGDALTLADIVGDRVPLGKAGHAELHLLDIPAQHDAAKHLAALQLYATVSDLNAPGPGIAAGKLTFEGVLTGLPDDVRTYGEADLVRRWQAAGGKLQVVASRAAMATRPALTSPAIWRSTPPLPPSRWPSMLLLLETGVLYAHSPRAVLIAAVSASSFAWVLVPWALMYPMSSGFSPASCRACRRAATAPRPWGCGSVIRKASPVVPYPVTSA